eukprot:scaffold136673_cov115-Phaeocystis_antarctica.AAC.1
MARVKLELRHLAAGHEADRRQDGRSGELDRRERHEHDKHRKVERHHNAHDREHIVIVVIVGIGRGGAVVRGTVDAVARGELDEGAAEEDAHQRELRGYCKRV